MKRVGNSFNIVNGQMFHNMNIGSYPFAET